jgi:hypothetical protein
MGNKQFHVAVIHWRQNKELVFELKEAQPAPFLSTIAAVFFYEEGKQK